MLFLRGEETDVCLSCLWYWAETIERIRERTKVAMQAPQVSVHVL